MTKVIKPIIFALIGVAILWLVFIAVDANKIFDALKKANYFWIFLSLLIGLLSHLSRAIRWNILIRPLGYKPSNKNLFMAVMVMYLANTAVPRSGEFTRCGIIKQYEGIPFRKLLGTVVVERMIDLIMLILLLFIVLISQHGIILDFFQQNVSENLFRKLSSKYLWIIIGIVFSSSFVGFYIFRLKFKHTTLYKKFEESTKSVLEGIRTIRKLDNKLAFVGHSIFIYVMYYLMIYVCFFAFDFTSHLGMLAGLSIFVLASLGMVAPSPGGLGTWHVMAIGTLLMYGISAEDGTAFSIAVHGATTLMLIVVGAVSYFLLPIFNRKKIKQIS